jgi:spore germination cell wall hydrolase CwlJ-like protein
MRFSSVLSLGAVLLAGAFLSACASGGSYRPMGYTNVDPREQACMARAMFFESRRDSVDGMLGVGTVVMNRVASPNYPDTVCEVVGQKNQFAPGVLTRPMDGGGRDLAFRAAYSVLKGQRLREVGRSMFFHTAGYSFGYDNMHYLAIAGGNAFYEKVSRQERGDKRLRTQAEALRLQ